MRPNSLRDFSSQFVACNVVPVGEGQRSFDAVSSLWPVSTSLIQLSRFTIRWHIKIWR